MQFATAVHTEAVVTTVPVSSGNVIVRFAVNVAVISVAARLVVPPARPCTIRPSCVAAWRKVWPVAFVNVLAPVKAFAVPSIATVPLTAPNATEMLSVPVNVNVLLQVNVLPSATVIVALVAGAVMVTLLIEVAEATPSVGVVSEGLVANTSAPVPVSSVTAAIRLALEGVARNVATPVPRPDTPVLIGSPVQLVNVPDDGVPRTGVVSVGLPIVGDVASTMLPEPVVPLLRLLAAICAPLI